MKTPFLLFLKFFGESFLFAMNALRVNRLRTVLSLLGITIGIFAIISVFTVTDALETNVRESVKSLGDNVVYIQKWPWEFGEDYPWWKYVNRPLPGYNEMKLLEQRCSSIRAVAYIANINNQLVKYQNNSVEQVNVIAATQDYDKIKTFELSSGRYFTESESNNGKPVAIVGASIAASLFPDKDPVGESIIIHGLKFSVIGVFKKEGASLMESSLDENVLITLNYARNIVNLRSNRIDPFIMAEAKAGVSLEEFKADLLGAFRSIRSLHPGEADNFSLNESTLLSNGLNSIFGAISVGGWIIGGFAILVGGFGIANIMFVSVKERTSQIGIQKALGAKNYFILLQFLFEAVVLCILGGIIGLLIVYGLSAIATKALEFNLTLTYGNIILGLVISTVIGIVSGFVPAYNASRMSPVEAIRAS